jgi:hypothetical protein
MPVKINCKYDLNDLHQEIALFDRKIAYCQNFEKFASDEARAGAIQKLETKRLTLVKKAQEAVGNGIEIDPRYLPASLSTTAAEVKAVS